MSKHIGTQDSKYASLFLHESWKELLEMAEPSKVEVSDMVTRVCQYLAADSNENLINLPVAEAMGKKIALKRWNWFILAGFCIWEGYFLFLYVSKRVF